MSQGGAVAVAYAVRHPERVSQLVLVGAYARGALRARTDRGAAPRGDDAGQPDRASAGGSDNTAFRQVFTNLFIPDGTPEQHQWWNELRAPDREPGERGAHARRPSTRST